MDDDKISELIALAWDDKTSFEMIEGQTGMTEKNVIEMMRKTLKPSSFRLWRKRVSGRTTKHAARMNALT
jgi:uncharacterized protein (TIGR03643 family)